MLKGVGAKLAKQQNVRPRTHMFTDFDALVRKEHARRQTFTKGARKYYRETREVGEF